MQRDSSQTAAYKIFHWKYQCRIPEMVVYSDAVLENFGTFVSGDEGRDVSNARMLTGAIRTIAELATIHGKGYKVEIDDDEKCYQMYSIIRDHIADAVEFQKNGLFGQMPPMEDLATLDKFAGYIFPRVRHHFVSEEQTSSKLMSFLKRGQRFKKEEQKEAPEAHQPFTAKLNNKPNHVRHSALSGQRLWK